MLFIWMVHMSKMSSRFHIITVNKVLLLEEETFKFTFLSWKARILITVIVTLSSHERISA